MSQYNVGDKVRIVNKRNPWWNMEGKMDKHCGKVMTIRNIVNHSFGSVYFLEEDQSENCGVGWAWASEDFERLVK